MSRTSCPATTSAAFCRRRTRPRCSCRPHCSATGRPASKRAARVRPVGPVPSAVHRAGCCAACCAMSLYRSCASSHAEIVRRTTDITLATMQGQSAMSLRIERGRPRRGRREDPVDEQPRTSCRACRGLQGPWQTPSSALSVIVACDFMSRSAVRGAVPAGGMRNRTERLALAGPSTDLPSGRLGARGAAAPIRRSRGCVRRRVCRDAPRTERRRARADRACAPGSTTPPRAPPSHPARSQACWR